MHWTEKYINCTNCGASYLAHVIGQTVDDPEPILESGVTIAWKNVTPKPIYSLCPECFPKEVS